MHQRVAVQVRTAQLLPNVYSGTVATSHFINRGVEIARQMRVGTR